VRIPIIENTLSILIWLLGMLKIALANSGTVKHCPSCFDHQRKGFSTSSKGTQMIENKTTFIEPKFTQISCNKKYFQVYKQEKMISKCFPKN
jgi:hypothetical protein